MQKKLQSLWLLRSEQLIQGSFWLTVGGLFANFGNYLFNLVMGRLLSPNEYGTLMALLSLSFIVSLPSAIIGTIITKFTADFSTKKEDKKIAKILKKFTEITVIGAILVILAFILFNHLIQQFLNIRSQELVVLTGIMIGIGLVMSINQGVYRGLLLFKALSLLGLLTVFIKLIFGWVLVNNNMAVYGAMLAIFISNIIPWVLSYKPLIKYFKIRVAEEMGLRSRIFAFSLPTFAFTAATTFYLNADLLLVKHYFLPNDAGIYAAVSVMGKAIFYVLGPISMVLFSLVSQKFAAAKDNRREVRMSLLITSIGGLCALIIYFLFPDFIVRLFFPNSQYALSNYYIFYYGLYMFFYSLSYLMLNFFLATEKNFIVYVGLVFSIGQIVFIALFHETLLEVITVSTISVAMLTLLLTIKILPPLFSNIQKS